MLTHIKSVNKNISNVLRRNFSSSNEYRGILDRLESGPVIGDGGFVFGLEKRGFVRAGPWTPEANLEFPEAVKELHTEFARAGSDVMQTFTFYASEDKLENRGNYAAKAFGVDDINSAACDIARSVALEYNCLVAGGLSQTPTYLSNEGNNAVIDQFKKQLICFKKKNVDFMIVEYFEHVEECILAIEACKDVLPGIPIAANLCINDEGDLHGISTYDCAIKLAECGADIIGLNCHFGPNELLKGMAIINNALKSNGYNNKHLMVQPVIYHTPDAGKQGFIDLPEFPFALEPRVATRWDIHQFARNAYNMGIRYIGGCCGFEPYHIRAIAQELEIERGGIECIGAKKHEPWGGGLNMHTKPWVRARANKEYWQNIKPASGRPLCGCMSIPDQWNVTQGDDALKQQKLRHQPQ